MIQNKQLLKKKEQGYALIIVLLVITVFSVLGLTVMSVSFNHTKQFSKETTQTQALNVAEMGLKAYDKKIKANIDGLTAFDASQFQSKLSGILPETFNSSSDSSLNSMQGNPSYSVTRGDVSTPSDNKITVTITSQGTADGETQTITQAKTFEYQGETAGGSTGDDGGESNDNNLDLPLMNGALIMETSENDDLLHPNRGTNDIDQIFIEPNTQKCVGATYKKDIDDFQNKFSQIDNMIKENTSVKNSVTQIPSQVPPIPTKPSVPTQWTISNADQNTSYDVVGSYSNNINFTQDWLHAKGPNNVVFDHSVSVKNLVIDTGTNVTIKGDLYVQGKLEVNSNLKVEGKTYVNGDLTVNTAGLEVEFAQDLYVGQKITLNSKTSFGGNVSADDITVNDTNAVATFGGNVYSNKDFLINADTTIAGNVYVRGKFTVNNTSADTTISGYLYSGGETTFNANTTITQNVYSVGKMTINPGSLVIHGNAFTGGDITMNTTVSIDGNLYVSGKIDVNSNNNSNEKIHVGKDIFSGQDFTINDEIEALGNVYASGKLTLNSNGKTNIGQNIYVGGELTVNDNLDVNGNAYSNGKVVINGAGRMEISGNYFINSSIDSSSPDRDSSLFNGTVYVRENAKFQQNKTRSGDNDNALYFKKGLVINKSANLYTANDSGTIRIGLIGKSEPGDGGSTGDSGSNVSNGSPVTIISTRTSYH